MSLVQEALKRKSEEDKIAAAGVAKGADTSSSSPIPPPPAPPVSGSSPDNAPPPAPSTPPRKRPGKGFIIWLLFLVILASLSYAAYYLFTKGLAAKKESAAIEKDATEQQQDLNEKEQDTEQAQPGDLLPITKKKTEVKTIPTRDVPFSERSEAYKLIKKTKDITQAELEQQKEAATLLEPSSSESAAPAPTAIATATPVPAPIVVKKEVPRKKQAVSQPEPKKTAPKVSTRKAAGSPVKVEEKEQQEAEEPVEWPRIRLNGVMATRNRTDGIAIIDGKLTGCGQEVQGVKLISVHKDGVVLEYKGEIRTLRVGGEMF